MLTSEQKTLKKAAMKEVFEAILKKLNTAFMGEPFKNSVKSRSRIKKKKNLQRKYNNLKQLWRKFRDKKKWLWFDWGTRSNMVSNFEPRVR